MSYVRKEELAEGVVLYQGDCLEVLPTLGRFDACVTDPPYGIGFEYASYDDTRENLRGFCVVRDVDADALLARFLPTDLPGRFGSPVFSQAMNEN